MNSRRFRLSNHVDTILRRNSINNQGELATNYQQTPFTRSSLLHKGKRSIDKNIPQTYSIEIIKGNGYTHNRHGIESHGDVKDSHCKTNSKAKHREEDLNVSAKRINENPIFIPENVQIPLNEHSGSVERQAPLDEVHSNVNIDRFPGYKCKQADKHTSCLEQQLLASSLEHSCDPVLNILRITMDRLEERENAKRKEKRESRSGIKQRHSFHLPSADDIRQQFREIARKRPGSFRSPHRKDKVYTDENAKSRSILKIRSFARLRRLSAHPRMNLHESIISHSAGCDADMPVADVDLCLSDLVFPDHTGWLTDQATGDLVWGLVSDMLLCLFKNKQQETPSKVIVLPGCGVRTLVFSCPKENGLMSSVGVSKTISGVDKYQFIVDDKSLKTKHLFSVERKKELEKWVSAIQKAASLEIQADFSTTERHSRRDSVDSGTSLSSHSEDTLLYDSPRYVPSAHLRSEMSPHSRDLSVADYPNSASALPMAMHLRSFGNHPSVSTPAPDSLGDFKKKLRKNDTDSESRTTPMKAMHTTTPALSKSGKMKPTSVLKRSFGSLDNLFRIKKKSEHRGARGDSLNNSINYDSDSIEADDELKIPKRGKSRSLDFGKSSQAFGQVVRRASDLKDKMFSVREKSKNGRLRLSELSDVKHSGYLHYKSGMKWTKLYCVVCGGCFYCYKSDSDKDSPQMAINLSNCEVCYVTEIEKRHKRLYVFRLSHSGEEDTYLSARDKGELAQWLHVLQMAANKITAEDGLINNSTQNDDNWSVDSAYSSPSFMPSSSCSQSLFNRTPFSNDISRTFHVDDEHHLTILRDTTHGKLSPRRTRTRSFDLDQEESYMASNKFSPSPNGEGSCGESISARLDKAVFNSWRNDKGHLFQILRAKLNNYRKKKDNIYDKHLPGPNGDGLLVQMDENIKQTIDEEIHNQKKSHRKEIRRSKSLKVSMEETNGSGESDVLDETQESRVFRKRRRPFAVRKIASHDLNNPDICGYMDRRGFSGKWTKYWFVLLDGCLYCYLTPDDKLTADVVKLHGHSVTTLEDKIRGRRFIVQLLHEEYTTLSFSLETREAMVSWFEELKEGIEKSKEQLKRATDEKQRTDVEKDVNSHMSVTELKDKYNELKCSVKQKLLEEVLRQKDELERKQAVRNKSHSTHDLSLDSPRLSSTLPHSHDEQRLSDMTRLTQRRMSAQIKVDTIQKQLGSSNHSKRSLFHFGHKKKAEDEQKGHLQEQLQELTSRLQDIDKSLKTCKSDDGCCGSCEQRTVYPLPQRAFSYNGQNGHGDGDNIHRDANKNTGWKASVQSFAKKTLYKSKKHKHHSDVTDGASGGSMSDSDSLDESVSDRLDGPGLIDLTRKHNTVEARRSLDSLQSDDSLRSNGNGMKNNGYYFQKHRKEMESPRRQIAPSVMAEIDDFEEFAKQMLDRSVTNKR